VVDAEPAARPPNPHDLVEIRRIPWRSQISRTLAEVARGGTMQPAVERTGSTMTHDTSRSLPRIACSIVVAHASRHAGCARSSSQR
jgi:hypothetical protein